MNRTHGYVRAGVIAIAPRNKDEREKVIHLRGNRTRAPAPLPSVPSAKFAQDLRKQCDLLSGIHWNTQTLDADCPARSSPRQGCAFATVCATRVGPRHLSLSWRGLSIRCSGIAPQDLARPTRAQIGYRCACVRNNYEEFNP